MQPPSTSAFDITEATDTFTIDGSGNGNNTLASDYNGNQTFDGSQFYTYDGWNRLMTVSHGYRDTSGNLQHGQASVTNRYDAKGRRIIKVVNNTGSWDCTYNYYYKGNQQIEQQNGSNRTIRQNIWGLGYIDNLIQTSLNSDPADQSNCDTPYWVLQDANYNVLGILNSSGVLVERYEYSAYGQRTVYFSPGSNDPFCMAPTVASQRFMSTGSMTEPYGLCEFGHQGLMHDEEDGLVYDRRRFLAPALGRFLRRDPMGYVDGKSLYAYDASNPIISLDPGGAKTCHKISVKAEVKSYEGLGGALDAEASGELCNCDCGKGHSVDVTVRVTVSFGVGIGESVTIAGTKYGYDLTGPQLRQGFGGSYKQECGEPDGTFVLHSTSSAFLGGEIGAGDAETYGFSGSFGGNAKLDYGVKINLDGFDAYLTASADITAEMELNLRFVNYTFSKEFEVGHTFETGWIDWN